MEFFNKAKVIHLRSHTNKYLFADKDEETVRLSSNNSSQLAHWTVEIVQGCTNLIRLKTTHGLYLTVSDDQVLIGVNGRKVIQASFNSRGLIDNPTVEWEIVKDGLYVKLKCKAGGMFLKGNGGVPPWRNTVTCALPQSDTWVLWTVDVVEGHGFSHSGSSSSHLSTERNLIMSNANAEPAVSEGTKALRKFSSLSPIRALTRKQRNGSSSSMDMDTLSISMTARATSMFANTFKSGSSKALGDTGSLGKAAASRTFSMKNVFRRKEYISVGETGSSRSLLHESKSSESSSELFSNAKTVRLRSQHNKYLVATENEEEVHQSSQGSSKAARWKVEFVEGTNKIQLRSCYQKYLTATDETFLFGGKKVMQTSPQKLDSSVQWEPFPEGMRVKLKTRCGNFLCGNGGLPPWRNTVTYDLPQRTASQDWILWDVEILEIIPKHNVELKYEGDKQESEYDDEESDYDHEQESEYEDNEQESEYEDNEQESECESEKIIGRTNLTVWDNDNLSSSESDTPLPSKNSSRLEISRSFQTEGRLIYYSVVKNDVEVPDMIEKLSINFKGNGLDELKEILAEKSGIQNFLLYSKNALNGQLYPVKLQLPPNKTNMHVFLVPTPSKF